MLEKVKSCVKDLNRIDKRGKSRPKYDWTLGDKLGITLKVCRNCFAESHCCSHFLVDACCKEIRPAINQKPVAQNAEAVFNDRTAVSATDKEFYKDIQAMCISKGISLTAEQRAMMYLPNTVRSIDTYTWIKYFFQAYGDSPANSKRIHLDDMEYKVIYKEYVDDVGELRALGYHQFLHLWYSCFPHVRLREYKQCCGKCMTCHKLTDARRTTRSGVKKKWLQRIFFHHRITFMGERATYAQRRFLAMTAPERYLSTISGN